jgi:hypothetical protein
MFGAFVKILDWENEYITTVLFGRLKSPRDELNQYLLKQEPEKLNTLDVSIKCEQNEYDRGMSDLLWILENEHVQVLNFVPDTKNYVNSLLNFEREYMRLIKSLKKESAKEIILTGINCSSDLKDSFETLANINRSILTIRAPFVTQKVVKCEIVNKLTKELKFGLCLRLVVCSSFFEFDENIIITSTRTICNGDTMYDTLCDFAHDKWKCILDEICFRNSKIYSIGMQCDSTKNHAYITSIDDECTSYICSIFKSPYIYTTTVPINLLRIE